MAHLNRAIRSTSDTSELLGEAAIPVYGIRWPTQVIRRIGHRKINGSLFLLRNPKLSQTSYARVAQLRKGALLVSLTFPPPLEWGRWRSLVGNFDLDERLLLPTWIPIAQ